MSDSERETLLELRGDGVLYEQKRVIAIDVEQLELVVVSDEAYRSRDFSALERVPFAEALWIP